MITAFELDDLIPARESASEASGGYRRFCAAGDHANEFDRGYEFANEFSKFDLEFGRCPETGAERCLLFYRLNNHWMRMTDNMRTPRADVIDIAIPIGIPNVSAFATSDEERFASHGAKGTNGRINAARNTLLGAKKKLMAFGICHKM